MSRKKHPAIHIHGQARDQAYGQFEWYREGIWKDFFFLQQALELPRDRLFDYHYISQSPNFDPLQFARHCAWLSEE